MLALPAPVVGLVTVPEPNKAERFSSWLSAAEQSSCAFPHGRGNHPSTGPQADPAHD